MTSEHFSHNITIARYYQKENFTMKHIRYHMYNNRKQLSIVVFLNKRFFNSFDI